MSEKFTWLDNPIYIFLSNACDIMWLNILWFICSIPIITMGASTIALYTAMLKIVRGKGQSVTKMFFCAFRENLKQGCILTGIFCMFGFCLYMNVRVCEFFEDIALNIFAILIVVLMTIYVFMFSYVFPLLAQFENSINCHLKNAFAMSVCHLHYTILIVILNMLPIGLFLNQPRIFAVTLPFWGLIGIALIALINTKMFVKIFDQYIIENRSEG